MVETFPRITMYIFWNVLCVLYIYTVYMTTKDINPTGIQYIINYNVYLSSECVSTDYLQVRNYKTELRFVYIYIYIQYTYAVYRVIRIPRIVPVIFCNILFILITLYTSIRYIVYHGFLVSVST